MMSSLRSVRFWGQLALTAGFLVLLGWRVPLADALATLPEASWLWVPPALLLFTLSKAVHAYRWKVLQGPDSPAPYSGLLGIFLVHNMANAVLLLRAGDLLRIQTTSQRYGIPRSELTATVIVVETLLDGLTFILLVGLAFVLGDLTGVLRGTFWGMAGLALMGLALGIGVARFATGKRLERSLPLRWLSPDIRARIMPLITQFLGGMRALRELRLAVPAIILSVVGWLMEAASYWLLGYAFGLDLGMGAYLLIMMTANFAVSIPLTPSGVGPYEVATQELAVLLGAPRALAAGYAIGIHVCFIVWITIVGLVAMWLMRLRLGEIFYIEPPPPEGSPQPETS